LERAPEFLAAARERIGEAELADRIELVEADAATFELGRYDAALCLGATFVYGGLVPTLERLRTAAPLLGVGEPYWRTWPLPDDVDDQGYVPLAETMARFHAAGLAPVSLIAASEDDWDRYESLHWRALEEWLAAHPDDPDSAQIRSRHEASRDDYLRRERDLLGWAIFVTRKP
jgi:hypothetical protein